MNFRRFRAVVALTLVAACAIPAQHDTAPTADKLAIDPGDVAAVYERYQQVHAAAVEVGSAQPLSVVEGGSVLAIDSAAFGAGGNELDMTTQDVAIARFGAYPLWFVAVAANREGGERHVQVFARSDAVSPWLLVHSPRLASGVELPGFETSADAAAIQVAADDTQGLLYAPQAAGEAYVAALSSSAPLPEQIASDDDFIAQMRQAYADNVNLPGVQFSQSWQIDPIDYALRTSDGGALVFVTLHRFDEFTITPGTTMTWPEGTAQQLLAPDGVIDHAVVGFDHQVLLKVPPNGGGGQLEAVGHFGGVVSID